MVIESLLEEVRASHRKVNSAIYKRPDLYTVIDKKKRITTTKSITPSYDQSPSCEPNLRKVK